MLFNLAMGRGKILPLVSLHQNLFKSFRIFWSFDGTTFITEPSSQFPHEDVGALGSYRNSPFVTGCIYISNYGLKTEILDYEAGKWEQVADYPFADKGDTYVKFDL